ncbi:MAG: hypothetical protein O2822_06850 [Chloroflexi bacterium]|nr:hypothetical protein [Chloroflexota bacterium]
MWLGIDFDNTFADFGGLLRRVTLERTGVDLVAIREANPHAQDIEAIVHATLGKDRLDALVAEILESDLSLEMEARPGALDVARRLAANHEIVVVTARSVKEAAAPRRWLERHGIAVRDLVATDRAPKASHAVHHGLLVHLDDNAEVFADFDEAHPTVPALIAHPMNARSARAAHWRSVEDWLAFERLVKSLEQER